MAVDARRITGTKPPGRPRIPASKPLVRRNVLLDAEALARLRSLYAAKSDSEAVRQAIDAVLLVHDIDELADRLAASGGPDDVYYRTAGERPLPVHFDPAKVTEEDTIRLPDARKRSR